MTRPVFHSTPAPTPTPRPTPTDRDNDGIPDTVENRAPGIPGPNGAAPMVGDGNGDGIKDSAQPVVLTANFVTSPTGAGNPAGARGCFVTLVAGSQDGKFIPGSDVRISSMDQRDAPAILPEGMEMPIGLIDFQTTLATVHGRDTFSLYVDPALGVNGYWVKDKAGIWTNLASTPYGGKMVTEGGRLRLDFKIDDGGQFDIDGQADGVISATGATAQMPLSIVGQTPDTTPHGFWL